MIIVPCVYLMASKIWNVGPIITFLILTTILIHILVNLTSITYYFRINKYVNNILILF